MNHFLKGLSFPLKLMLTGLVPLFFLIYFAIQIINEKNERIRIANYVIQDINNSATIMELADEVHLERRLSFSYAFGKIIPAELTAQFSKTDETLTKVDKQFEGSSANYKKYSFLDLLPEFRGKVINKQVSPNEILDYYSNLLIRVLDVSHTAADKIPYLKSIEKDLRSQEIIFKMANYLGLTRSSVYSVGLSQNRSPKLFEDINKNYALLRSYWDEFLGDSEKNTIEAFQAVNKTPEAEYINKTLSYIVTNKSLPKNFDAEMWWKASANVTDAFKKVNVELINTNRLHAQELQKAEKDSLNTYIFFLTLIILLVVLIVFYTIRSITTLLTKIRTAAEEIALGAGSGDLEIHTNDAIGSLANSIRSIDESNISLAKAADAIGRGEFDIDIRPRSSEDTLSLAIIRMKNDLQIFAKESNEKIWVQTGLSLINDSIKGEKTLPELTNNALNALINYLEGQIGVLYISNNDTLHYSAGYALPPHYTPQANVQLGETLIGQSAKQQEIVILDNVPDYHVKITSGTGESAPRHLAIIPLIHNNQVEGVIEIGSIHPFAASAKTLIEIGSVNIAIAFHSAKSRARLQELLEETQAQSEELQTQHSELENLNTELEAQAQKLQTSEEELKVQQEELLEANQELEERSRALEEKNQLKLNSTALKTNVGKYRE